MEFLKARYTSTEGTRVECNKSCFVFLPLIIGAGPFADSTEFESVCETIAQQGAQAEGIAVQGRWPGYTHTLYCFFRHPIPYLLRADHPGV